MSTKIEGVKVVSCYDSIGIKELSESGYRLQGNPFRGADNTACQMMVKEKKSNPKVEVINSQEIKDIPAFLEEFKKNNEVLSVSQAVTGNIFFYSIIYEGA